MVANYLAALLSFREEQEEGYEFTFVGFWQSKYNEVGHIVRMRTKAVAVTVHDSFPSHLTLAFD